jgi:restriction endonuclease S subunit
MITYSVIQKSQLEGALRLDAEYYQPEYLELTANLNNLGAVPIRDIAINPKRKFKPQKGKVFQYIEISEVDLSTGEYDKREILGEDAPDRAQWVVKQNDVIVSTVRPIRNAVSLIRENIDNLVCSSGFAVLRPEKIEPEYLFIYLKSRQIVKLLDRKTTATMYPAISIDDLLNTKIYLGDEKFREEIKNKVIEAQKQLKDSKSLYSQAENLLLEELGLKDFEIEDELFYIVNLSEIKSAHRADAEYFQPKYEKLVEKIKKKVKISQLGNIASVKRGSLIPPRFYEDMEGIPYIRGKDFSSGRLEKANLVYISSDFRPKRETRVKTGDIVFASIGSVGSTVLVTDEFNNSFISNNTGKISIRDKGNLLPEYLAVVLHSMVGKLQFEKEKSQTAQPKISDLQVRNFYIPILPQHTQQKIAELVRKSYDTRLKAKQLLEEAKNKVESLIE